MRGWLVCWLIFVKTNLAKEEETSFWFSFILPLFVATQRLQVQKKDKTERETDSYYHCHIMQF